MMFALVPPLRGYGALRVLSVGCTHGYARLAPAGLHIGPSASEGWLTQAGPSSRSEGSLSPGFGYALLRD